MRIGIKARIWAVLAVALLLAGCRIPGQGAAPVQTPEQTVQTSEQTVQSPEEQSVPEQTAQKTEEQSAPEPDATQAETEQDDAAGLPREDGSYYDLQNVVLYLELYGKLPDNYITKGEARDLGWEGGSVEDFLPDAAIGGDRFGNREGILPQAGKNTYYECDIDTHGYKNRGSRRLIYTADGNYYYTGDHYESFRQVIIADDHSVSLGETLR